MGLAVSQVRLLSLTSRKADIELQMQVDAKRKQMLMRKGTELSQQYYRRLKDSNIQYATSNGYENVTFNYLMGQTNASGVYTEEFMEQVMNGSTDIPQKFENNMILTDQYGQVVVNNQVAEIVEKINLSYQTGKVPTYERTARAIVELIDQNQNNGLRALYEMFSGPTGSIDEEKLKDFMKVLKLIVLNGGEMEGGKIYTKDFTTYYVTAEGMKTGNACDIVHPKEGYVYQVLGGGSSGAGLPTDASGEPYLSTYNVYMGGTGVEAWNNDDAYTRGNIQALGNLVAYFSPILSAALTNGTTAKVEVYSPKMKADVYETSFSSPSDLASSLPNNGDCCRVLSSDGKRVVGYIRNESGTVKYIENKGQEPLGQEKSAAELAEAMLTTVGQYCRLGDKYYQRTSSGIVTTPISAPVPTGAVVAGSPSSTALDTLLTNVGDYVYWDNGSGSAAYYYYESNTTDGAKHIIKYEGDDRAAQFYKDLDFRTTENDEYYSATNSEVLQDGFKSGVYQLCMVTDSAKGIYHKNTTMNYFTRMNYVVERADSGKKEEITAWFNAENAALNEQETYWDAEIQNLSAELSAVTTEIEAVKKLKSNSIKDVFNWGGQ